MERYSFHQIIITLTAMLMVALFTGLPKPAFSQSHSVEGEIGFYYNYNGDDYGDGYDYTGYSNGAGYIQFLYTWWLNKYVGGSAGVMFVRGVEMSNSWTVEDKWYTFDKRIYQVNGVGEVKVSLPVVWRFGLTLNARFMFEPIPFEVIPYQVYQGDKVKSDSHYVYTRFNLSGIINAGLYFDYKHLRFSLGYGRGSYDTYNTYKYASIDGHNLSEHIPRNSSRYIHNLFLSVTVF